MDNNKWNGDSSSGEMHNLGESKESDSKRSIKSVEIDLAARFSKSTEISGAEILKILFGWLYNHNPFYLISAGFFLFAMTQIFETGYVWINTWIPMGIIASYTLLMAGTAILIVRLGRVWKDARSIVVIVILLLATLPVSLDGLLIHHMNYALLLLLCGFGFSLVVSEAVIWGLRMHMRNCYRLPFYAILGLFFLYPYITAALVTYVGESAGILGIMLFPAAAGIIFLSLIPAIVMGKSSTHGNLTPWNWPWFPWTLFALLAIAVCGRSYLLSLSFFGGKGVGPYSQLETGFGLYMLIPFFLCLLVLLNEHALRHGKKVFQYILLVAPALFFLLAVINPVAKAELHRQFLEVVGKNASPLLFAFAASLIYYLYAWIRGIKFAEAGMVLLLLLALLLDLPSTEAFSVPDIYPLIGIAVMLAWYAVRFRHSAWMLASATVLIWGCAWQFNGTWYTSYLYAIPANYTLLAAIAISFTYRDKLAVVLRYACAYALLLGFVLSLFIGKGIAPNLYIPAMALYFGATLGIYLGLRKLEVLLCVIIELIVLAVYWFVYFAIFIHKLNAKELKIFFWGGICFIIAVIISMVKSGMFSKYIRKITPKIKISRKVEKDEDKPGSKTIITKSVADELLAGIFKIVSAAIIILVFLFFLMILFHIGSGGGREKARRISCASNLKQIGLALEMYSNDYMQQLPDKSGAAGLEQLRSLDYITDYKIFICPSSTDVPQTDNLPLTEENVSYCFRGGMSKSDSADSAICWDKDTNHGKFGNVLYIDGHVIGVAAANWKEEIR